VSTNTHSDLQRDVVLGTSATVCDPVCLVSLICLCQQILIQICRGMWSWALAPQFVILCVWFPSSACVNKYSFRAALPTLQNLRAVFVISRIESGVLYFRAFPTVSREHVTCTRGACGCLGALTLLTALPPWLTSDIRSSNCSFFVVFRHRKKCFLF